MTNSEDRYPPDDYVIGESYPPPPASDESEGAADGAEAIGSTPGDRWGRGGTPTVIDDDTYYPDEDADDGLYEDDDYYVEDEEEAIGSGYYYYDDEPPARQPAFYIFIAIAVILGGLFVFLLFSLFRGGDDENTPVGPNDPAFNIRIDSPLDGERVQVGRDIDVLVQANSNEQIVRIELLVNDDVEDLVEFSERPEDGVYSPTMTAMFPDTGEYEISARAVSESGATAESDPIEVIVNELIDDQPASITGEIISTVNARTGPGEEFPTVRTFDAGERVVLVGRSAGESEWVLLDSGVWLRAAALRTSDSIALLPVRRPTPTPAPSSTPTPEPSETATPDGGLADLSPSNATLGDEGETLRVTVRNQSTADYEGPLVVSAVGLPQGDLQEAFLVDLPAGGNQVVEFELPQANTEGGTVQVSVDVGNNIEESNEDNNDATFVLSAAVDPPELSVAAVVNGPQIAVTVTNVGGRLETASVFVSVTLGGTNSSETKTITLESGQSEQFVVSTPPNTGTAEITVFVNGEPLASGTVQVGEEQPTATPEPTTET